MKKIFGLFLLLSLSTAVVNAQTKTSKTAAQLKAAAIAKDEKAVAEATDRLTKLIITPDKKGLEDIAAAQLTYCHSSGKLQNKAEFVDDLVNGTFDFLTVDITNQTITMSGDVAVVRQSFASKATNAGAPAEVKIGNCLVWQKQAGKWKLLARQAFKIPGT